MKMQWDSPSRHLGAHLHQARRSVLCRSTTAPSSHTPAGLHSHCPNANHAWARLPPLHTSLRPNKAHILLYVIVKHSLRIRLQHSGKQKRLRHYWLCGCGVTLFIDSRHYCEMTAERNGRIIEPWPRRVITLVFMRERWYRAKVHQPRQGQVSVPCLRMVGSVCTRQTGLCFASCRCVDYFHTASVSAQFWFLFRVSSQCSLLGFDWCELVTAPMWPAFADETARRHRQRSLSGGKQGRGGHSCEPIEFIQRQCAAEEAGDCWRKWWAAEEWRGAGCILQLWLFVDEQLLLQDRGVCGCRVGARSGGIVTRMAPMKRVSSKISAFKFPACAQRWQTLIWSDVKVALN